MSWDIIRELNRIINGEAAPAVMAMVVHTDQSAPRHAGSKMIIRTAEDTVGTIGGGAVEHAVVKAAIEMLSGAVTSRLIQYDLNSGEPGEGEKTGMMCGGAVTVYLEAVAGQQRLIVFGAGHIGQALAVMAEGCGLEMHVVDHRSDFAKKERFPSLRHVVCQHPVEYAKTLSPRPSDTIVIVTHRHAYDFDILNVLLSKSVQPAYLGMIGSKSKVSQGLTQMREKGIPGDRIESVRCPIGLDIGADTPMELAIAIMAEIIALKNHRASGESVGTMKRFTMQK